jgi:hypothetical protein
MKSDFAVTVGAVRLRHLGSGFAIAKRVRHRRSLFTAVQISVWHPMIIF